MTENEIIEILQTEKSCVTRAMKNECNRDCYNCDLCEEGKDILTVYDAVIKALEEREQYRAIGTIEEFKALKENERKCEDCAGCTTWKCDCANIRAKAIDEAIEASAKAICVGCGYLEGYKCNYKGANCGVSKPMLESVVKALEQMKEGAE